MKVMLIYRESFEFNSLENGSQLISFDYVLFIQNRMGTNQKIRLFTTTE